MDVRHTITFDADNKAEIVSFHIEAPCLTFRDIEHIHTRLHSLFMEQGTPVTYDTPVVIDLDVPRRKSFTEIVSEAQEQEPFDPATFGIEQARQLAFRALSIAKESRL